MWGFDLVFCIDCGFVQCFIPCRLVAGIFYVYLCG